MALLRDIEARSEPYVMSGETMKWITFNFKVQIIRLTVAVILLLLVKFTPVQTKASQLDKDWVIEFLQLMILFFIFVNVSFIIPMFADTPIVFFIILRVFAGALIALYYHWLKGFTLYEDLTPKEAAKGRDSTMIYGLRIVCLLGLTAFVIYLTISLVCLIRLGGLDGR